METQIEDTSSHPAAATQLVETQCEEYQNVPEGVPKTLEGLLNHMKQKNDWKNIENMLQLDHGTAGSVISEIQQHPRFVEFINSRSSADPMLDMQMFGTKNLETDIEAFVKWLPEPSTSGVSALFYFWTCEM